MDLVGYKGRCGMATGALIAGILLRDRHTRCRSQAGRAWSDTDSGACSRTLSLATGQQSVASDAGARFDLVSTSPAREE